MTYDELVASIQSYTENQFPATYLADGTPVSSTSQINTFIKQAEDDIAYMNTLPNKTDGASAAQFDLTVLNNIAGMARQGNRNDVYERIMPVIQRLANQVPRPQQ